MICISCRGAADLLQPDLHKQCNGETWCDCQHREVQINA